MSNIYKPFHPKSVDLLQWTKKPPEVIKEMEARQKIGFKKYGTLYKKAKKEAKNKAYVIIKTLGR